MLVVASGSGLAQLVSFLSLPFISRLYAPSDFGRFAIFSAVCWMIAVLATVQLEHVIIIPKLNAHANGLVQLIIIIGFAISFGSAGICYLSVEWFGIDFGIKDHSELTCLFVFLTVIGITFTQAFRSWYVRCGNFAMVARGAVITAISTASFAISFGVSSFFMFKDNGLIISQSCGLLVTSIYWYCNSKTHGFKGVFPIKVIRLRCMANMYGRTALILLGSNLFKTSCGRLPHMTISSVVGNVATGFYVMAEKILSVPALLIGQSIGSVYRNYSKTASRNREYDNLAKYYWYTVIISVVISIPIFLILYLSSPVLFVFLFGDAWSEVGDYASIIIFGELFVFILSTVEDATILVKRNLYRFLWHALQLLSFILIFFVFKWLELGEIKNLLWSFVSVRITFALIDFLYFWIYLRKNTVKFSVSV